MNEIPPEDDRNDNREEPLERREREPGPVSGRTRDLILIGGAMFCVLFGALTVLVAVENGLDFLILVSLAIIVMVLLGIIGAIRNPPRG